MIVIRRKLQQLQLKPFKHHLRGIMSCPRALIDSRGCCSIYLYQQTREGDWGMKKCTKQITANEPQWITLRMENFH